VTSRTKGRYSVAPRRATAKKSRSAAKLQLPPPRKRPTKAEREAEAKRLATNAQRRAARAAKKRAAELATKAAAKARAARNERRRTLYAIRKAEAAAMARRSTATKPPKVKPPKKATRRRRFAGAVSKARARLIRALAPIGQKTKKERKAISEAKQVFRETLRRAGYSKKEIVFELAKVTRGRRSVGEMIRQAALDHLPGAFRSKDRRDRWLLRRTHLQRHTAAFEGFITDVQEVLDLDDREAVDAWFSPEAA
jgi:hypothetical protein